MKRHTPTAILAVLAFALATVAVAQNADPAALRIAFVDTQALIRAHPASAQIEELSQALETELAELQGQRQELLTRQQSQGLTAEEQELLQALTVTIQTRQESGVQEIRGAAAPAEEAANEVIREIASNEGYSLVLDIAAAGGLVVYAGEDVPDITQQAMQLIEERFPAE